MVTRRVLAILLTALGLLAVSASGAGALPPALDALGPHGDQHVAFPVFHSAQYIPPTASVVDVGDVNGDAADDVALMLDSFDSGYTSTVWITSAGSPPQSNAGEPGWRGWRIVSGGFMGGMAGLDDVNGDGIGEVAVAVRYGEIAVVFGRHDGATVDVRDLGDDGFRILDPTMIYGNGGGGNSCCGVITGNATIVAAGDQNDDGRPDLAWATYSGATVAYTPVAPAGATVDATALGSGGFQLVAGALPGTAVTAVGNLGDLSGDGRADLVLAWSERYGVFGPPASQTSDAFAATAASPGPGETVDLRTAPAAGTGFLLRDANSALEYATTIGDRNGDGRRDTILADVPFRIAGSREGLVAFTPPLGTVRELRPLDSAFGRAESLNSSTVFDAGDQDGDGVTDLGQPQGVHHSSGAAVPGRYLSAPDHGGISYAANGLLVGSVADRNGDGRRELLVVRADPWDDATLGAYAAGWNLETYLSAPAPVAGPLQPPVLDGSGATFAASFTLPPAPGVTALPAQAGVEVTFPGGFVLDQPDQMVHDATAGRIEVAIRASGPGGHAFAEGQTYTYRSYLETSRGQVAWSATGSFVYHNPGPSASAAVPATAPSRPAALPAARARGRRIIVGTPRRDRLVGTPRADILRGLGGNDELFGLRGADRLEGGPGRDRLVGGPGRDVVIGGTGNDDIQVRDGQTDTVRCGAGRDRVRADRRDHLTGCERVRRS